MLASIFAGMVLVVVCAANTDVPINPKSTSRQFDGIGAISGGGATSRLLVSYPEEQLEQLLDLLFKPNFAASLHILKVEIGGDAQSTDGTEHSHMHAADDLNYHRGYEWWLMTEAKARNPSIKLYGLPWAFPAWVGNGTGNPYAFPNLTADYITKWVQGAQSVYNLTINYVGIWNERSYNITYIETLRAALDDAGFEDTVIVAPDSNWEIAVDILADPKLAEDVYAIGCHYPGTASTPEAEATAKPLWASEDMSTYNDLRGAGCWARVLNQNFVNGNMTATISWNLIASYYEGLPWYGTALLTAVEPWSGHFDTDNVGVLWATAHTTQFAQPGWFYLKQGAGSGFLQHGGSFVTLTDGSDFSIIIEKMAWAHSQCIRPALNEFTTLPETITFTLEGAWADVSSLNVWYTRFGWDGMVQTNSTFFQNLAPISVSNGQFTLTVNPDELYSITTLTTVNHAPITPPPASQPFPSYYTDNFDNYEPESEAQYFADQAGAFEIYAVGSGNVMRQVVPTLPICWSGDFAPFSVIGDEKWGDTIVTVDVLIESTGAAFVGARCRTCCNPEGVFLSVNVDTQQWALTNSIAVTSSSSIYQSGSYTVKANTWYTLSLSVIGTTVNAWIGSDQVLNSFELPYHGSGWAAIGSSQGADNSYTFAQFDNFVVNASEIQCPVPAAGAPLSVMWCGAPNEANSEWLFRDGMIILKSNPSLCVAGTSIDYGIMSAPATLALCNPNDSTQQFQFANSTSYPFTTVTQNKFVLGVQNGDSDPDSPVILIPTTGTFVRTCSASDPSQKIQFTGTSTASGQLQAEQNMCITGYCTNFTAGCAPLALVPCDSNDPYQFFFFTSSNSSFQNQVTRLCMDLWGHTGPQVGQYECHSAANQEWSISGSSIRNRQQTNECLSTSNPSATPVYVVLDEAGNGQITTFGSDVTDHCVGICYLNPDA
eukprot:m.314848 g.314848  ORF g.314848 m.314848 type:complete len:940 (+) comp55423_c0_seq3:52-2871(+)